MSISRYYCVLRDTLNLLNPVNLCVRIGGYIVMPTVEAMSMWYQAKDEQGSLQPAHQGH